MDAGICWTPLESLTVLTVLSHWALKARLENHVRNRLHLLQCCECCGALTHVADADPRVCAAQALSGEEIDMQVQTGVTGKGR